MLIIYIKNTITLYITFLFNETLNLREKKDPKWKQWLLVDCDGVLLDNVNPSFDFLEKWHVLQIAEMNQNQYRCPAHREVIPIYIIKKEEYYHFEENQYFDGL